MTCVKTTSFSLCLNGSSFGYFKEQRGLRQGDHISPLIFTLCMDYLTRMTNFATDRWPFQYHPLCKGSKLNHLMFADDLLMFCKGNANSIMLLIRAFSSFSKASGLTMNTTKSEVYYNGLSTALKLDIQQATGKADRLWIRWVNQIYIKNKDWHHYTPPQDASWAWKCICKVKEIMKPAYDGDQWTVDARGYSIRNGYEWLRPKQAKQDWYKIVWSKWNYPKYALISWIAMNNGLMIKERLFQFNCCTDDRCCICDSDTETQSHLFFYSHYSK
ncbi:uncharacterized protein LOC141649329 [Silene latifolia]|uniref:uncharacterized protein LOC141649329 n=1 Tax=Silene latifolia TaxID=37657 RepID=UPI003D77AB2A